MSRWETAASVMTRGNFYLSAVLAAFFLGAGAYCAWHGVRCWPALGFSAFFWLLTYMLSSRL